MGKQTILVGILILALAATAFIWFRYSQLVPAPEGEETRSPEAGLSELRRLKEVRLDASVFQDPFFRSLEELPASPAPTAPEAKAGRMNPFLPF